ncbi:hypothetical protein K461DRAFT_296255 [Myriangium duriaei CBS 260.36]|uniref:Uncharacterized protein n=1 Tax=Myriangium duriaei CBS 260.36 TaxID=1168546 RepID=A0A9P4IXV2_9PEZI|nr:hypothetical protein K461DRAFT_296255 [Myriangium duriaei CBS 260.36]
MFSIARGNLQEVACMKLGHNQAELDRMTFIFPELPNQHPEGHPSVSDQPPKTSWSMAVVNDDRQFLADKRNSVHLDPSSQLLCLSSEQPSSAQGQPAQRLFLFVPPDSIDRPRVAGGLRPSSSRTAMPPLPLVFRVAMDLTFGVRVVAAYGKTLVLYTIPPDAMETSPMACRPAKPGVPITRHPWMKHKDASPEDTGIRRGAPNQKQDSIWRDWWPDVRSK